jgi:cell division protein FtsN
LVGGSFKEEENAEKYRIELKEKGFNPFLLGKRGNFYIVGIGTFKTEAEAVAARRDFTEKMLVPAHGYWKNKL